MSKQIPRSFRMTESENRQPPPLFLRLADLVARHLDRLTQPRDGYARAMLDHRPSDLHVGAGDAGHTAKARDDCAHAMHAAHAVDVENRSHPCTLTSRAAV